MVYTQKGAWINRGWLSFTVANNGVLYLGAGALQTAPTAQLSTLNLLTTGIPQKLDLSAFADLVGGDPNGHTVKHVVITLVSAGANTPAGRTTSSTAVPTSTLGAQFLAGDSIVIENGRQQIFNWKFYNASGGNAVVEVEVFE